MSRRRQFYDKPFFLRTDATMLRAIVAAAEAAGVSRAEYVRRVVALDLQGRGLMAADHSWDLPPLDPAPRRRAARPRGAAPCG